MTFTQVIGVVRAIVIGVHVASIRNAITITILRIIMTFASIICIQRAIVVGVLIASIWNPIRIAVERVIQISPWLAVTVV